MNINICLQAPVITTDLVSTAIRVVLAADTDGVFADWSIFGTISVIDTLNADVIDTIWNPRGTFAVPNALHTSPVGAKRHYWIIAKSFSATTACTAIAGIGILKARDTAGHALTAE